MSVNRDLVKELLSEGRDSALNYLVKHENFTKEQGTEYLDELEGASKEDKLAASLQELGYEGPVPIHTASIIESLMNDIEDNQSMSSKVIFHDDISDRTNSSLHWEVKSNHKLRDFFSRLNPFK